MCLTRFFGTKKQKTKNKNKKRNFILIVGPAFHVFFHVHNNYLVNNVVLIETSLVFNSFSRLFLPYLKYVSVCDVFYIHIILLRRN